MGHGPLAQIVWNSTEDEYIFLPSPYIHKERERERNTQKGKTVRVISQ